jgi:phosphatidate cytidylyltransferase
LASTNLTTRLVTSGIVAPLILVDLLFAPALGWYAVVLAACGVAAQELFAMTHPGDRIAQAVGVATTLLVSAGIYFFPGDARVLLSLLCGVTITGLLVPLWRLGDLSTAALRIAAGIAGPFYIGGLLTTLGLLRRDALEGGGLYVVFVLLIAWWGDTGGYFAGRYFGRTKLYEAVSPKKTREGFYGALGGSLIGALLAHFWFLPQVPLTAAVLLALFGGALGQFGDLAESLLKRSTGIKDSGWSVPGHGGMLDRIDAVLIASPIVYLYGLWSGLVRLPT